MHKLSVNYGGLLKTQAAFFIILRLILRRGCKKAAEFPPLFIYNAAYIAFNLFPIGVQKLFVTAVENPFSYGEERVI